MPTQKTTKAFITVLALISIFGFLAIISDSIFNIDIGIYTASVLMVLLGLGLIVEGKVLVWKKLLKGGISNEEFTKIITGTVGILAVIMGLISFAYTHTMISAILGILSIIAIIVIVVETFLVKWTED